MLNAVPVGEVVRPMARGQVTIPAKIRTKLKITPKTPLNIFDWRGMIVIVPVEFRFKKADGGNKLADWAEDDPEKYMAKVRYNPLEKLWVRMARGSW